ncbi:ABC transporter substrate-binding protein [Jiella pelagia]|uniref:ABC transporter substrate-binding protein n=1 Tax=Jiella pelagia TaxID=2986949 RepID=A0ABY7CA56_9HYPH|nr:ABC transporter substrate-binding protein [Jiella pelagia]WAP70670.1 ABC transporter substrate-binding protein [Jiella pelagia]
MTIRLRALLPLAVALLAVSGAAPSAGARTLVFCSEGQPETLSPPQAASSVAMDAIRPIFDTLVAFAPGTTDIVPALAESWTISPDGRDYTFRLRSGVAFQPGKDFKPTRPMNAEDVVFSFKRQLPGSGVAETFKSAGYEEFRGSGLSQIVERVDVIDEKTVRFRLKQPDAPFLADLAMPVNAVQSAEYAYRMDQQGTREQFDQHPIGTGPFRLADRGGIAIRYQAFDGHWRGQPKIDTLVFSFTPTASLRLQKLKSGECHVAASPDPADAAAIRADTRLRLSSTPGLTIGYLAINTTRKPFDDVRVRRAINLAIDREAILSAIYPGTGRLAAGPLPGASWANDATIGPYRYDPQEARRLLLDAGVTSGLKIDLWFPPDSRTYNPDAKRMAHMISADLEPLGIMVEKNSASWETYWRRLMNGETTLALAGWIGDNGDPDDFMETLLSCAAARDGTNIARWCDQDYDALIAKASRTRDRATRAALYAKAQRIFHEAAPWVPIASAEMLSATRAEVRNFVANPLGFHDFAAVDLAE